MFHPCPIRLRQGGLVAEDTAVEATEEGAVGMVAEDEGGSV